LKSPRLVLDLDAVSENVASWCALSDGREIWAVVKADAYRLGAPKVAQTCLAAGAKRLVAADVEEASELRKAGITAPILLISATPSSEMAEVVRLNLIPTIAEVRPARELAAAADRAGVTVVAHVGVDTNTGWAGVPSKKAGSLAAELARLHRINWEGAYTHFAGPDSANDQRSAFDSAVAAMRTEGLPIPVLHVSSTAPALWGIDSGPARVGIGLYGSRLGTPVNRISLRTPLSLSATVIVVKQFDEPSQLGYGGKYTTEPGETIATLRIGYGDGLPGALDEGEGSAVFRGNRCAIKGAIGMQFTMVRVPTGVHIEVGEEMTLLGDSGGIELDEVARRGRVLPHQLVTALGAAIRPSFISRGTAPRGENPPELEHRLNRLG
jgi:alanine racemase